MQRNVCWAHKLVHSFSLIRLHIFTLGSCPVQPQSSAYCPPEQIMAEGFAQGHFNFNSLNLNKQILPNRGNWHDLNSWPWTWKQVSLGYKCPWCSGSSKREAIIRETSFTSSHSSSCYSSLARKTWHMIKCSLKAKQYSQRAKEAWENFTRISLLHCYFNVIYARCVPIINIHLWHEEVLAT